MILRLIIGLSRILLLVTILASLVALPRAWAVRRFGDRIYTLQAPPTEARQAAIVFGAGLRWDGRPTIVLADRVRTAVELYELGLVEQLIMSGTSYDSGYDEPAAMAGLARQLGIPAEAIELDSAGTRTIETCRQAIATFDLASVYLVSQNYHLPRALATCQALGLEAEGVAADMRSYRAEGYWRLREVPATLIALWESYLSRDGASLPTGSIPS